MPDFGPMTDVAQPQSKPRGAGTQPRPTMVTAIHGDPEAVHSVVSRLHQQVSGAEATNGIQHGQADMGANGKYQMPSVAPGSGTLMNQETGETMSSTNPRGKVNSFGGSATQPEQGGAGELGQRFNNVLAEQPQRIASLLNQQGQDAASIRAEHASNAPLEREHMTHTWADEDTQRHQQMTTHELANQKAGWEFKREQQFESGNPTAPHWAIVREKVMNDPLSFDSVKGPPGPDGKPTSHLVMKPQTKMFLDYIDGQMAGHSLGPQGPTAPPPEQGKTDTENGGVASAMLEAAAPAAATSLGWRAGAKYLAPLVSRIPRVGGLLSKAVGPATGLTAGALTGGVANELDPNMLNNLEAHKSSATLGGIIGTLLGVSGMGRKNVPVKSGTPEATALEEHAVPKKGVGAKMKATTKGAPATTPPASTPTAKATPPAKTPYTPVPIKRPFPGSSGGSPGDITPPGERGRGFPATGTPTMITRKMEQDLLAKGLTKEMINKLTPQQAWELLVGATH